MRLSKRLDNTSSGHQVTCRLKRETANPFEGLQESDVESLTLGIRSGQSRICTLCHSPHYPLYARILEEYRKPPNEAGKDANDESGYQPNFSR